jgi:hypothetical protein
MNCGEFQKVLPYIIESGGNPNEEAHLASCKVCADLVQDLRYIAEQAKLLLPMRDPSPEVWDGIRNSLEREGLVGGGPRRLDFNPAWASRRLQWASAGRLLGTAALLALAIGVLFYNRSSTQNSPVLANDAAGNPVQNAAVIDGEDMQVLQAVSQRSPGLRDSYEADLRAINAYIDDAQQYSQEHPDDALGREHLMEAHQQKSAFYEMALERSVH